VKVKRVCGQAGHCLVALSRRPSNVAGLALQEVTTWMDSQLRFEFETELARLDAA